ncbi:MAG TPA: hypothetical protein VGF06_07340 [Terriglobales bacterium]
MKKTAIAAPLLLVLSVALISCYGSSKYQNPSRLKFRAFVSNSLHPTTAGNVPAVEIMNAVNDRLTGAPIGLGGLTDAGAMDLSPNGTGTLVYSPSNNAFVLIDNATEKALLSTASLPDSTESFFIAVDNLHAYAAVPNAQVNQGQAPPGAIYQIDLSTGSISAVIPVPHVHFLLQLDLGKKILAFSDNSSECPLNTGAVTLITPANIGTNTDPRSPANCGFDHPVGAIAAIASQQAFVLECGPECGGTSAAITAFDSSTGMVGTRIPVPAATAGLLEGTTMFVAGSPPNAPCDSTTAATTCGRLTLVDLNQLAVTNTSDILITDGYHTRLAMGAGGQLFIGARNCTKINVSGGEIRGCLSIFDTGTAKVVIPPNAGDVTGLAPIPQRTVVYVIQDGELRVFDTTTDALLPDHQTDIVGQLVDVKAVDKTLP